jgi:hypothetical protein
MSQAEQEEDAPGKIENYRRNHVDGPPATTEFKVEALKAKDMTRTYGDSSQEEGSQWPPWSEANA